MNGAAAETQSPITVTGGDACDIGSIPYAVALQSILDKIQPIQDIQRLPIRSALNRVAAEEVTSKSDIPAFRNSAMDGYACRASDLEQPNPRLKIAGVSAAGSPFIASVEPNHCIRVLTGAVVPDTFDTVVMQEDCDIHEGWVSIRGKHRPGSFIRKAGDDISSGEVAIRIGQTIGIAELGVLASVGCAEISVYRKPIVAFFSTGDELRGIGESLGLGDVYDSNRYTLFGLLENSGALSLDLGVVRDDLDDTIAALKNAANSADLIITSAGASVGDSDFVKQAVESLGELTLRKVAMKPGRPLAFGKIRDSWFFGLPGNPVSVMVTFDKFVLPALQKLMGLASLSPLRVTARCVRDIYKKPGRLEFQRGFVSVGSEGNFVVDTTGDQSSGVLTSMSKANCYIVLPLECGDVTEGSEVEVEPFEIRLRTN